MSNTSSGLTFELFGRQRKQKRRPWRHWLPWESRHHVVPSRSNNAVQKNQRWYFDRSGAVGWKRGEFNDLFSFKPDVSDLADHRENIRRIFVQFPQYVPAMCKGKRPRNQMNFQKGDSRYGARATNSPNGIHGRDVEGETGDGIDEDEVVNEFARIHGAEDVGRRVESCMPNYIDVSTNDAPLDQSSQPGSRKSILAEQSDGETLKFEEGRDSRAGKQRDRHRQAGRNSREKDSAMHWCTAKKQLSMEADSAPVQFLQDWCKSKHTTMISTWRRLDTDKNMLLKKREFMEGMRASGYPENLEELWKSLDRDHTGILSFFEFVPEHALDLMRFKHWVEDQFGNFHEFFVTLDSDHNGKLSFEEFQRACEMKGLPGRLQESIRTIFLLCEDPDDYMSVGDIKEAELDFLDVWQCPVYLREAPDAAARLRFQDALLGLHDRNSLIAWRAALDIDASMRVGFAEFVAACHALARAGLREADPENGVPALYCALDINRSGWFTLRDWDKEMYALLHSFYIFCKQKHNKVVEFVRSLEDRPGSGICVAAFSRGIAELNMAADDQVILFDGLSVGKGKRQCLMGTKPDQKVYVQDVLFLDGWHPEQTNCSTRN